jgi:hypothetical protein
MSAHPLHQGREFPWEQLSEEPRGSRGTGGYRDRSGDDARRPVRLVRDEDDEPSHIIANLPGLLRQAADAIKSAEARANAIEEHMAEAIAAAAARVKAAEDRARSAEDLAQFLEQRATEAVKAAEKRAADAEERAEAAEEWIARVRNAMNRPK